MDPLAIIILAAGLGKRMRSELPKVAISTIYKPLISHVVESTSKLGAQRTIIVTGHKRGAVEECLKDGAKSGIFSLDKVSYAFQEKQLGTGDAVRSALPLLKDFSGTVLIVSGDTPLISSETLGSLLELHHKEKATLTLLTFRSDKKNSYGRVIRDKSTGEVLHIREALDCSPQDNLVNEFNGSIYAVDAAFLNPAVAGLKNNNAQKEYYLTDIVERAAREGQKISSLVGCNPREIQGVNTPYELSLINQTLVKQRAETLMLAGVEISDLSSTFVSEGSTISPGVKIGPNVQILGRCRIESGVVIEGTAYLRDVVVGANSLLRFGLRAEEVDIGANVAVGPFAHLRPGTVLEDSVHIGNFVETKKAHLHKGAKANHLTYLGDCEVGSNTNVGAGTITCNYDGYNKYKTTLGKGVFVGSNTSLVAPVTIEDGATIGAGSVISKDVSKDSLALTRAPQIERVGWSKHKRDKIKRKS